MTDRSAVFRSPILLITLGRTPGFRQPPCETENGARPAEGRSCWRSSLSALWKAGSGFPVDPCVSDAAPLLRAFIQVPWRRSACALANFTAMVAAYHPFPKPHGPRSAGVRAERPRPVWVGLLSGWGISNLYQPPRKAISAFLGHRISCWRVRCPWGTCPPGPHG